MLNTRMFSVYSGTPGKRQQIPRTSSMMRTPAQEASDSLLMTSRSVTELTLKMIWPSLPFWISSSISSMMRDFMHLGATISVL